MPDNLRKLWNSTAELHIYFYSEWLLIHAWRSRDLRRLLQVIVERTHQWEVNSDMPEQHPY